MSFLVQAMALRAYADNSWLNIMALNTAITDGEVIGFTNRPWLGVYSGTGLYGSYFRDWWAVCQRGGLVVTRNWWSLCLREASQENTHINSETCISHTVFFTYYGWNGLNTNISFLVIWLNSQCACSSLSTYVELLPLKHVFKTSIFILFSCFLPCRQIKFLLTHRKSMIKCVCWWDWVGGNAEENLPPVFLLELKHTAGSLSHAFCSCPNRSQGDGSIWRLIIVSKSRFAPTTCIFQASRECPNAFLSEERGALSLLVWSLDWSCAVRKLDHAPGVTCGGSMQLSSAPPTGRLGVP